MTKFVVSSGEVFEADKDPHLYDTYCHLNDNNEITCYLLSTQSEVAFLMAIGDDLNLKYDGVELRYTETTSHTPHWGKNYLPNA